MLEMSPVKQEISRVANDAGALRKAQVLQVMGGAVMAIGTVIGVSGPALSGATLLAGAVMVAGFWISGPVAHRTAAKGAAGMQAASSTQAVDEASLVVIDVAWGEAA